MKARTSACAGRRMPTLFTLAVTALGVSACGSGSGSGPMNAVPTVSPLTSLTINQDTPTAALAFTVSDDGGADALTLSVTSSNTAVVPLEGISLSGSGANRAVTVTPAEEATGQVSITVKAQDAQGLVGMSTLALTVKAVEQSIANYTNGTFAQGENDTPTQVSGFTFVQDADDETTFASLLL